MWTDPIQTISVNNLNLFWSSKARRGYTDLDNGVAAIRLEGLFYRLPDELQKRADDDDKQSDTGKPKKKRSADYELPQPFVSEWQYKIVPPLGFQPKPLPHDVKMSVGPAVLTETFSQETDGTVHADIRFDTVKRRFTIVEATELRNRVADLKDGEAILINFESTARALLEQGKPRDSFQSLHRLISQHPTEALHHLQLAQALLEAGLGDAARQEASIAVKLEPKSALAQQTLAEILESDLVGRKFRLGSDYAGAAVAFREGAKLDPDGKRASGNLGILLEYNHDGMRYGPGSHLKEAIATYRSLGPQKLADIGLSDNLAFALFYDEQFGEAKKEAETLNPQPASLIIACEAALNGVQAAIGEASKRSSGDADAKQKLKSSGEMLMNLRKYSLAADLLQAGASGENTAATMSLATTLRKASFHEQLHFGATPGDLVRKFLLLSLDSDLTIEKLSTLMSKNALIALRKQDVEKQKEGLAAGKHLRSNLARKGTSIDVTLDLLMQMLNVKEDGDDLSGYRERVQMPGGKKLTLFVVKEDGQYKLLDTAEKPDAFGLEVLDRIAANNTAGAATLLNWLRDDHHIEGGDDPLAGEAFPRIWTKPRDPDAQLMRVAAASILVESKATAQQGITILDEARKSANTENDRVNIDLGLLAGSVSTEDYAKELAIASALADKYPESRRLFFARSFSLRALGRTQEADQLAAERLKTTPDDLDAMRSLVLNAIARQDLRAAYEGDQRIIQSGRAEASDYNNAAWQTLFFDRDGGPDVDAAIKASQMSPNTPYILHTLGCIYAELGKVKEARDVLLQGMDLQDLDEPDSSYWYAFGRVAEQYGEGEIALADYGRVDRPTGSLQLADSTYQLAQTRSRTSHANLQALKAAKTQ